ncbi:MAG: DUF222 domain-containing protein [Nocardioidaceae bacterium]
MTTAYDEPAALSGQGAGDLPGWALEHGEVDRALLDQMVTCQITQNRAHAARLEAIHTFHSRRVAEQRHPANADRRPAAGVVTPLHETQGEVAPLIGASEQSVAYAVDTAETLMTWLPRLWERCRTGRLEVYKALACADQLPHLASDADRIRFATAIQDWVDKHDPIPDTADPEDGGGLCTLTRDRIGRAARYQRLKLPKQSQQETFAEAFRKRRVSLRVDEQTGMAWLSGTVAAHDAITADYRLTLIARKRAQAPGETRTLAQLRADSLLDLIHGRLTVPATTGDLEHHEGCDQTCLVHDTSPDCPTAPPGTAPPPRSTGAGAACPLHPLVLTSDNGGPLGGYARPVVHVTVPISTLLGCDDTPGLLTGGTPIPADYTRHLAALPGSTWYRMLTDDAGTFHSLSTHSYQPTEPIWRTVTARDQTCIWPGCTRPSAHVELDHRDPYPDGETSTDNLQPLCRRHHQLKHAPGYHVTNNPDGSYTWTTRHGSTFTVPASEQPIPAWPAADPADPADPADRDKDKDDQDRSRVDEVFHTLTSPLETAFADLIDLRR